MFQQNQHPGGTSHCLNIFASGERDWSERERVEFSVKSFLYLSKLHRKEQYDRMIVADCDGAEPLLVSNLSILAPVWVQRPQTVPSRRGELGYAQLEVAQHQFELTDWVNRAMLEQWPPEPKTVQTIMDHLRAG